MMALLGGKLEARRQDCAPVAGKSTLNRLELSRTAPSRYHKIIHDPEAIESLFVEFFLEAWRKPPSQIILDLDATDIPLHGEQEGRFFHGYYDCHCYLPLYVYCGRHLLAAKLRRSNQDAGPVQSGRVRASSTRSARAGRAPAFCCAAIPASPARSCWPGARPIRSSSSLAWPATPAWPGRSPARSSGPRRRPGGAAGRSGATRTSSGRRWTAGRAGGAWSPRRSGWATRPTRASSSPL